MSLLNKDLEYIENNSNMKIEVVCNGCNKLLNPRWIDYKKCVKSDGSYYCNQCANNGNKKWISFYDWCYINLSKTEADKIIARWDYDLNIDKNNEIISPKNISHGSNKKYWFKCNDNITHHSEQKNINTFTNKKQKNIDCNQCNSVANKYPFLLKFLVNKDDALNYSICSHKKVLTKCPNCGHEKYNTFLTLLKNGFGCPKCSDGISYPEKFLFIFLEELKLQFITQLSKINFKWCLDYRYDFYVPSINCIIETHGEQHYNEKKNDWDSLEKIQVNDKQKELLAKSNNIINYISIDCRESNIDWIKNNIMQSQLPKLFSFKESDIDWLKCHEYACNSLVKLTSDLWNNGVRSTLEISNIMKTSQSTVIKYLKQSAKLGWCDYNSRESLKKKEYLFKKVICLNTEEIFNSIIDASEKYNIEKTSISSCCRRPENKSAGKHLVTGEKLIWMYYEDYIKLNKLDINNILLSSRSRIICLTTNEIFTTISDASKQYNIYISGISLCCNGKALSAGKHPKTKEPMKWAYYYD